MMSGLCFNNPRSQGQFGQGEPQEFPAQQEFLAHARDNW